jgi:YHS domain-containing protein
MTRWQWLARAGVFLGAILLMLRLCGAILAQPDLEYPRPCGCQPDVRHFGHHETHWRSWPGEVRLEQINPQAVTSGILPRPQGRYEPPPPTVVMPPPQKKQPQPQPQPQSPLKQPLEQPTEQPGQQPPLLPGQPGTPPTEESDVPKGGIILPPEGMLLPKRDSGQPETKPKSTKPSTPEELPGLPGLPDAEPPAKTPGKTPGKTPSKTPAAVPPKTPSKPATEKPADSSGPGGGLTPVGLSQATVAAPTPPAGSPLVRPTVSPSMAQPAATAAPPAARGGDAPVALAGNAEPEQTSSLAGAHRADVIEVTPSRSAPEVEPAAYMPAEPPAKCEIVSRQSVPSVALGGYCPVQLCVNGRWVQGDLRWTVVYQGWIYRLSGDEQRRQFLADPNRFVPVNSGNDVVLSVDTNRSVAGQTTYCATYNNRLYMFSSAATQAEFNKTPERYATR